MPAQPEFQQRIQAVEGLLARIEADADPNLRAVVKELLQAVMDLHGAGLERALELIHATGEGGENIVHKLGRDELVSSLLLLHGLHPVDFEARVAQGLDKARSRLRAQHDEIEVLSIQDREVRLRLHASGHGCGSSAAARKEIVEDAVYQCAPDVVSLIIESADEGAVPTQGFVPVEMLQGSWMLPRAARERVSEALSFTPAGKGAF